MVRHGGGRPLTRQVGYFSSIFPVRGPASKGVEVAGLAATLSMSLGLEVSLFETELAPLSPRVVRERGDALRRVTVSPHTSFLTGAQGDVLTPSVVCELVGSPGRRRGRTIK